MKDMRCRQIPDHLARYHAYTAAYRAAGSTRYQDFNPLDPYDPVSYATVTAGHAFSGNRDALVASIETGLAPFAPSAATQANIAALRNANTYAIVAGHQPSLFGGPLFLLWKILGIIRLCEQLNTQGDTHFVPVYWNGSEDHNPAEFRRVSVLDNEHDLIHLALPPDERRRMAAATPANDTLQLVQELEKLLPQSEFLPDLIKELQDCAHGSVGEMQTRLMLQWFGNYGLIVVEPHMLRSHAIPVIETALRDMDAVHACLGRGTESMVEMGFSAPLPHHEAERTVVYYLQEGERFRLRRHTEGFCLERRECVFAGDSIFEELHAHPERFSPAASLRPLVQDTVLPVAGYVAGGGELAYHLQLRELFSHLDVPLPLLLPRPAGTILKAAQAKTAGRLHIDEMQLLTDEWGWEAVSAIADAHGACQSDAFATYQKALDLALEDFAVTLQQCGVTNLNELRREEERYRSRLEGVIQRFRQHDPRVGDGARRQYFRLRKLVLPGERYQELSVWMIYFLALFGPELIDTLKEKIDPLTRMHHLFIAG